MIVLLLNPSFLKGCTKNVQLCGEPKGKIISVKNVSRYTIEDKLSIKGFAFFPICLHQEDNNDTYVYMSEKQFSDFEKRIKNIGSNNYIAVNVSLTDEELKLIKKHNLHQ